LTPSVLVLIVYVIDPVSAVIAVKFETEAAVPETAMLPLVLPEVTLEVVNVTLNLPFTIGFPVPVSYWRAVVPL
jgi:hypothetical protein